MTTAIHIAPDDSFDDWVVRDEDRSELGRFCCKRILLIQACKIDSRSSTNKQRKFKNPFVPIGLLRILILQLPRGAFCNKIGHSPTREEAEMVGETLARKHGGELVIHLPDGTIRRKSFAKRWLARWFGT